MIEEAINTLTFAELTNILKPVNGVRVYDRNHNVIPKNAIFDDVLKYGTTVVKSIEVRTDALIEITLDIEEE